jgi:hypothetical protein
MARYCESAMRAAVAARDGEAPAVAARSDAGDLENGKAPVVGVRDNFSSGRCSICISADAPYNCNYQMSIHRKFYIRQNYSKEDVTIKTTTDHNTFCWTHGTTVIPAPSQATSNQKTAIFHMENASFICVRTDSHCKCTSFHPENASFEF